MDLAETGFRTVTCDIVTGDVMLGALGDAPAQGVVAEGGGLAVTGPAAHAVEFS